MKINDWDWIDGIKKIYAERKYEKALKFILEYMDKYPKSLKAMDLYLKILMKLKRLSEVEAFIKNNCEYICNNKYYTYVIALFEKDYKNAYELLPEVIEEAKQYEVDYYEGIYMSKIFLEKQLNILDENIELDKLTYTEQQIVSYDENKAIEHIKKHQIEMETKKRHTLFESEIDLKELFYQIKKRLPEKTTHLQLLTENYFFEYPVVEKKLEKEGYLYKYLCVVAFRDTKEIITIYPYCTKEKILDVNELEEEKVLTKRLSQIDKFNKRYNKEK